MMEKEILSHCQSLQINCIWMVTYKFTPQETRALGFAPWNVAELPEAMQVLGNISHCTGKHVNGVSCLKTAGATHQYELPELPCLNEAELQD